MQNELRETIPVPCDVVTELPERCWQQPPPIDVGIATMHQQFADFERAGKKVDQISHGALYVMIRGLIDAEYEDDDSPKLDAIYDPMDWAWRNCTPDEEKLVSDFCKLMNQMRAAQVAPALQRIAGQIATLGKSPRPANYGLPAMIGGKPVEIAWDNFASEMIPKVNLSGPMPFDHTERNKRENFMEQGCTHCGCIGEVNGGTCPVCYGSCVVPFPLNPERDGSIISHP